MYIAVLHPQIIGKHTLNAEGLFKRIKPKRRVAENHGVFMRKAFLCQAAPPPFQVSPWTQDAKIRKEGAGNGEIRWPLEEMPQFRRDVKQAAVCYESTDYPQRGPCRGGRGTPSVSRTRPRSASLTTLLSSRHEVGRDIVLTDRQLLFGFLEKLIPEGHL